MGQDLREMFKKENKDEKFQMSEGHENRFLERLEAELPKQSKPSFYILKIAASILVLLSIGVVSYKVLTGEDTIKTTVVEKNDPSKEEKGISFGDLSPDLKKVEDYYVTNINLELSRLQVSEENKILVDSFMDRLADLNTEYERLNAELNNIGPNDQTITALIKNLQLRLQLLQKLKGKLNELKSSKNEQVKKNTI
ncbi:hypothetical protein [Ulvibacterium marinum]|uniref:hypothetical protein n=1 Tax=Ulvibacterium marinum TaxID=2419782 RepID=UPI0024945190|nr:hypothetical protein [Ulvibacterium marinum]